MKNLSIADFVSMFTALAADQRSYVPVGWRSPPGCAKTAVYRDVVAPALGLGFTSLELGLCDETDVAGIPVRDAASGQVVRLPIGPLRIASERPTLLLLDEVSRANEVKQGGLLTLLQDRRAGDFRLHPETIVALAFNGTESTGAFKLVDALNNRIVVVDALPTVDEVCSYLRTLGDPKGDAYSIALRDASIDWAATAERTPSLIQIEPPPGAGESGEQWPSPRMCEKAVRGLAALELADAAPRVIKTFLAGAVSAPVANAYFAVRSLRDNLPTHGEISKDPKGAKLPTTIETAAAVMALVEQSAQRTPDAAWIYSERITQSEIRVALGRRLSEKTKATTKEAQQARTKAIAAQARAIRSGL